MADTRPDRRCRRCGATSGLVMLPYGPLDPVQWECAAGCPPVELDLDAITARAPVWLLDVDGVVNAWNGGWGARATEGTATAAGRTFTLRWSPELIDRIRELHEAQLVEVRWCTTWCAFADELERLWKLPVLGRAFTEDINGQAAVRAKMLAARQVIAEGRRLIWTDDDVVPLPNDGALHDELTADGRALLIRPDYRSGLRPRHLDEIEAFAKGPAD